MADAGSAIADAYNGFYPPRVRLEGNPDGTAFALWERMDPATVTVARFVSGSWEPPVDAAGRGRLASWLSVSRRGDAIATWGEPVTGQTAYAYQTWSRRYVSGSGWTAPERLQSDISVFDHPPFMGYWEPPLETASVLQESGAAQAFWRLSYAFSQRPGRSGPDVRSRRLAADGRWLAEEVVAENEEATFVKVSRNVTIVFWRDDSVYRPQVFDAETGWQPPAKTGPPFLGRVVPAKGGFAITQPASSGWFVRGLASNGDMGPLEPLITGVDLAPSQYPAYDVCGNESGVLGFVRSDTDSVVLKYRSATDTPPNFTVTSVSATGRPVTEPVRCYADAMGRVLVVWRADQTTFAHRYLPGKGFEGATVIGPGFASAPAFGEDSQGNILVAWAVLTADKKVEIWWNRLRAP
ncbi:MAG: hypothetical protein K1Y01_22150 [Vicinamibacteria bacterium]|nr:hypothetical protein [Vicinamibacteria bacterium]